MKDFTRAYAFLENRELCFSVIDYPELAYMLFHFNKKRYDEMLSQEIDNDAKTSFDGTLDVPPATNPKLLYKIVRCGEMIFIA